MPTLNVSLLTVLSVIVWIAVAVSQPGNSPALAKLERAMPDSPKGYAPSKTGCPSSRPSVRSAHELSTGEQEFLEKRRSQTTEAMRDFLKRNPISDFDSDDYFDKHSDASSLPNLGIAVSGGGYRAMLLGAGVVKAFDNRTSDATGKGQLGGLLQSTNYVAGLSGGSWTVGSIFMNNFTTVEDLQSGDSGHLWELSNSIIKGPQSEGLLGLVNTAQYWSQLNDQVNSKKDAGFDISLSDYWGRAFSYQLIKGDDGGASYTWSSTQDEPAFKNGEWPMPIAIADSRLPGQGSPHANSTIFEFNPFEMGSYDQTVYGFVPLRYLGTRFVDGQVPENESCYHGFDNAGFIMGTSATVFNSAFTSSDNPQFLKDILAPLDKENADAASYPNPFNGYETDKNPFANESQLSLVDGGEDGQNLPLEPLLQPQRAVDVIFAVDASTDTDTNWPNGASLVATQQRFHNSKIANGTKFPAVPDVNTSVNNGLNNKPSFFGCHSNSTSSSHTPIIVYLPNIPYSYNGNATTFQPAFKNDERDAMIENGYNIATRGNATADKEWPTCVSCVLLSRSFDRTKTTVPDACKTCFDRYCWDGKTNTTKPAAYDPKLVQEK